MFVVVVFLVGGVFRLAVFGSSWILRSLFSQFSGVLDFTLKAFVNVALIVVMSIRPNVFSFEVDIAVSRSTFAVSTAANNVFIPIHQIGSMDEIMLTMIMIGLGEVDVCLESITGTVIMLLVVMAMLVVYPTD